MTKILVNDEPVKPPHGIVLVMTGDGRVTAYWSREDDSGMGNHQIIASVATGARVDVYEGDELRLSIIQGAMERMVDL
jgi:hypothetical protein